MKTHVNVKTCFERTLTVANLPNNGSKCNICRFKIVIQSFFFRCIVDMHWRWSRLLAGQKFVA